MNVSTYYLSPDQPWRKDLNFSNTAVSFKNMLTANGARIIKDNLSAMMLLDVDTADQQKVSSVIKAGAFNAKLMGTKEIIEPAKPSAVTVKPTGQTVVTVAGPVTKPTNTTAPTVIIQNPAKDPSENNASLPIIGGLVLLAVVMSQNTKKGKRRR